MHCQRLAKVWSIWLISEFSHYIYLVGVLVMYYGWVSLFWKSKKASSSPQTNLVARFKIYEMIFPATLGWSDDGNGLRSESRAMPNTWAAPSHAIPIVIIAIIVIIVTAIIITAIITTAIIITIAIITILNLCQKRWWQCLNFNSNATISICESRHFLAQ